MIANIHSIQTFGTVDGPGMRFVLFMQGCIMRCVFCHNPDTWDINTGMYKSSDEIVDEVLKYKNYYGGNGKITVSGGEPLLQLPFLIDLFKKCKALDIDTCLDTSGNCFNLSDINQYEELIKYTDLVMLSIKHIDKNKHFALCGQKSDNVWAFLEFLNQRNTKTWIRYVLVPKLTSDELDIQNLKDELNKYKCIEKIEVLPYHKLGISKYEALGLAYSLIDIEEPSEELVTWANSILRGDEGNDANVERF